MANHGGGNVRDSQRQRVYDAEHDSLMPKFFLCKNLIFHSAVRQYVNNIVCSQWWRNRTDITKIIVDKATIGSSPCSFGVWSFRGENTGYIKIPFPFRYKFVILHELAHLLTDKPKLAAHGPEFCKAYLALVRRFLGRYSYNILVYEFKHKNVKYTTGWTVGHNSRWNEKETNDAT